MTTSLTARVGSATNSSSSSERDSKPSSIPARVLDELDEAVHRQYLITNGNIIEGKNPHIKFDKNGGFTLATPKQEESDAEPLQYFFPRGSVAESPNHRKDHRHKAFSPLKVTLPSKGERRKLWR